MVDSCLISCLTAKLRPPDGGCCVGEALWPGGMRPGVVSSVFTAAGLADGLAALNSVVFAFLPEPWLAAAGAEAGGAG
eukprot:CAMPEP_0174869082 /NCGR_PEP_ID=MMETSP1114-20130205/67241_1 /TAXON_ID=312471 /ORGANISM="Neobodo designis, Strain CCAP 1951/1" /LENGTH=77 /DNA_ID=CAMNT_0016104315 /DNA_START=92 /DNA_END=321 /DNA_ORIENTATION=-